MSDRHQVQPYPLRLSSETREALEKIARDAGRSLHAEIIRRLEASLSANQRGVSLMPELEDALRVEAEKKGSTVPGEVHERLWLSLTAQRIESDGLTEVLRRVDAGQKLILEALGAKIKPRASKRKVE